MKKTYRRHKFLYFDDVAKKWTTQYQAAGDDEALDEVDFRGVARNLGKRVLDYKILSHAHLLPVRSKFKLS